MQATEHTEPSYTIKPHPKPMHRLPEGCDSGAQHLDGTTDITRTIALGKLMEEEKTDYTL